MPWIQGRDIRSGVIAARHFAAGAIAAASLADGAVTTAKLAATAVTTAKLALLAVDSTILAAAAVTAGKIAAGGISAANQFAAGVVDTTALAASAVTAAKIAAGVVSVAKLAVDATPANQVADPGNAGAIVVTGSGSCALTPAGAETRTLAIPTYIGQTLTLYLVSHAGDIVVTVASAINQAGNTIITMNTTADCITLRAIHNGTALQWRVVVNDGCTLS